MKELLNISHLYGYYLKDPIIKDISFKVYPHQLIGILGRNGCGKSTLFKTLLGNIHVTGKVEVKQQNFFDLSYKQRAKTISVLTQSFDVIEGISVEELIEFSRFSDANIFGKSTPSLLTSTILEELNLTQFKTRNYSTLSLGQQQMVQFARLIIQDTDILLLDEPDSALDLDHRYQIYSFLRHWIHSKLKAGIVISHHPADVLNYCDRIFLMNDGQIFDIIDCKNDSVAQIEKKLQTIYPNIKVKIDLQTNLFYTLYDI